MSSVYLETCSLGNTGISAYLTMMSIFSVQIRLIEHALILTIITSNIQRIINWIKFHKWASFYNMACCGQCNFKELLLYWKICFTVTSITIYGFLSNWWISRMLTKKHDSNITIFLLLYFISKFSIIKSMFLKNSITFLEAFNSIQNY